MTPSFKAAKAFFQHYEPEVAKAKPYGLKPNLHATLASWWNNNKDSYPRASFEDVKASVDSTLAYNAANPNRGLNTDNLDPIFGNIIQSLIK